MSARILVCPVPSDLESDSSLKGGGEFGPGRAPVHSFSRGQNLWAWERRPASAVLDLEDETSSHILQMNDGFGYEGRSVHAVLRGKGRPGGEHQFNSFSTERELCTSREVPVHAVPESGVGAACRNTMLSAYLVLMTEPRKGISISLRVFRSFTSRSSDRAGSQGEEPRLRKKRMKRYGVQIPLPMCARLPPPETKGSPEPQEVHDSEALNTAGTQAPADEEAMKSP